MHNTTTTTDHEAERARSYDVRRSILGGVVPCGYDGTGYAVTLRAIANYPEGDPRHVMIPAGTVCRVTTSNAGFRGIEGSARAADGRWVHGISLGAFRPATHAEFKATWGTK
jgi:hypothetical protein